MFVHFVRPASPKPAPERVPHDQAVEQRKAAQRADARAVELDCQGKHVDAFAMRDQAAAMRDQARQVELEADRAGR